jgi:hypothetical protein
MLTIVLTLALIGAVVTVTRSIGKTKDIALKKGIEEDDIATFKITLWLYVLPPIFMFFFADLVNPLVILVLIVFYLPGIFMARNLSKKLSRGADFERKAGIEYAKGIWVGLGGIGLIIVYWAFIGVQSVLTMPK